MKAQTLIHWLEHGPGSRWLVRLFVGLAVLVLSAVVAFKPFQGPRSEETLRQAGIARSLVAGEGFSSRVHYPQVRSWQQQQKLTATAAPPAVYHPPGYAIAIAATFAVVPARLREAWFARAPVAPDGFAPDYLLLVLNVVLLWVAAAQTWRLGRALFDDATGILAALALLLTRSAWQHAVAVDGTPLAMVLLLALFQAVHRADTEARPRVRLAAWLAAGGAAGALFLTDYPWALMLLLVLGYAGWRGRWPAGACVLAGALVVAGPWLGRNLALTGSPVGLAAQDVALRAGDPTAEPATVRATFAAAAPALSLPKVGNKTLTAVQAALQERLWASGGLLFTAFFVAGWLYRFRRDATQRLRWLVAGGLVVMVLGQGALNSGEGEREAVAVAAPLLLVYGAGFFGVLLTSSHWLAQTPKLAAAGLLLLQGAPLLHDVLKPRSIHFHYPPYHPGFFQGLATEMRRRGGESPAWMADVPAGAAWYSGQRVWAQPANLRDFYAIHADEPLLALVLTPHTLDRPYFGRLAAPVGETSSRFGDWSAIYRALAREQTPPGFPLGRAQQVAPNFYLLLDPRREPWREN